MEFGWSGHGEVDEHDGVGYAGVSKLFSKQAAFLYSAKQNTV